MSIRKRGKRDYHIIAEEREAAYQRMELSEQDRYWLTHDPEYVAAIEGTLQFQMLLLGMRFRKLGRDILAAWRKR